MAIFNACDVSGYDVIFARVGQLMDNSRSTYFSGQGY